MPRRIFHCGYLRGHSNEKHAIEPGSPGYAATAWAGGGAPRPRARFVAVSILG